MADLHETPTSPELATVRRLVADLASDDPQIRAAARSELGQLGAPAVVPVATCLNDPSGHVRWEAAKTLESIADPQAAGELVAALNDEDEDVRWVAAKALIALGEAALPPLLSGLIRHSRSVEFRRAAHHVLHDLAQQERWKEPLRPVVQAIDGPEPGVSGPTAAYACLRQLIFGEI